MKGSRRKTRRTGAGEARAGFSLIEVLIAVAVLVTVLLPALISLRFLLDTSEKLLRQAKMEALLEWKIGEARANARCGILPETVASGTAYEHDPLNWRTWLHPVAGSGLEDRQYALRCEIPDEEGQIRRSATTRLFVSMRGWETGGLGP